jgi:hypothetical protein
MVVEKISNGIKPVIRLGGKKEKIPYQQQGL